MKEGDILVSISCITYNQKHYIKDCIEGFLSQKTSFPFEVLIHDDASTDGTAKLIREYESKYPMLIKPLFQTTNVYSKGQRGINIKYNFPRAQGKYIALCEGDDYWTDPLKLQKQVSFLENNKECSFVFHTAYKKYNNQPISGEKFPENVSKNILDTVDYLQLSSTATSSLMFVNNPALSFPVLNHSHGDFLLYCELLQRGKAGFIKDTMSVYRKHEQGVSYNYATSEYLYKRIKELKIEKNHFTNNQVQDEITRIRKEHIRRYLHLYKKTSSISRVIYLYKELAFNKFFYRDLQFKFDQELSSLNGRNSHK